MNNINEACGKDKGKKPPKKIASVDATQGEQI